MQYKHNRTAEWLCTHTCSFLGVSLMNKLNECNNIWFATEDFLCVCLALFPKSDILLQLKWSSQDSVQRNSVDLPECKTAWTVFLNRCTGWHLNPSSGTTNTNLKYILLSPPQMSHRRILQWLIRKLHWLELDKIFALAFKERKTAFHSLA